MTWQPQPTTVGLLREGENFMWPERTDEFGYRYTLGPEGESVYMPDGRLLMVLPKTTYRFTNNKNGTITIPTHDGRGSVCVKVPTSEDMEALKLLLEDEDEMVEVDRVLGQYGLTSWDFWRSCYAMSELALDTEPGV